LRGRPTRPDCHGCWDPHDHWSPCLLHIHQYQRPCLTIETNQHYAEALPQHREYDASAGHLGAFHHGSSYRGGYPLVRGRSSEDGRKMVAEQYVQDCVSHQHPRICGLYQNDPGPPAAFPQNPILGPSCTASLSPQSTSVTNSGSWGELSSGNEAVNNPTLAGLISLRGQYLQPHRLLVLETTVLTGAGIFSRLLGGGARRVDLHGQEHRRVSRRHGESSQGQR
jgi:hypothetical protein